jgi:hypothetical protein
LAYRAVVPPVRCYGTGLHRRITIGVAIATVVLLPGCVVLILWDAARDHGMSLAEVWALVPVELRLALLASGACLFALTSVPWLVLWWRGVQWPKEIGISEQGLTVTYEQSQLHVPWGEVTELSRYKRVTWFVSASGTRVVIPWRRLDRTEVWGLPPFGTRAGLLHWLMQSYVDAAAEGIDAAVRKPPCIELRCITGPWWAGAALLLAVLSSIVVPGVLGLAGLLEDGWLGEVPFLLSLASLIAYCVWEFSGPGARTLLAEPGGLTIRSKRRTRVIPWHDISAISLQGHGRLVIEQGGTQTWLTPYDISRVNLAAFAVAGEIEPCRVIAGLYRRYALHSVPA